MPKVRVTVGGLVALLVEQDNSKAAAVLLKHPHAAQGHAVAPSDEHRPMLLVPNGALGAISGLAESLQRQDPTPLLALANIADLTDCVAFDLEGVRLAFNGAAGSTLTTDPAPVVSACPSDDWSSLQRLIDLNEAYGVQVFPVRGALDVGGGVATVCRMTAGHLSGHRPVERLTRLRKFSVGHVAERAFTDAFSYDIEVAESLTIRLENETQQGEIAIRADARAWILNLPVAAGATPGGHVDAYLQLPLESLPNAIDVREVGICEHFRTGTPALGFAAGGVVTTSDEGSGGVEMTLTVRATTRERLVVRVEIERDGEAGESRRQMVRASLGEDTVGLRPLGDGICMGSKATVSGL
jgi:hypothetical protein